jgi:hypothetical protein
MTNETDLARIAAANAAERLVLMEIWRPLRYIACREPRTFWREFVPIVTPAFDGWVMNDRGERVPKYAAPSVTWSRPGPWRALDAAFARRVLGMPNSYFTLDDLPGVMHVWRKFKTGAATVDDWRAIRALREAAGA